MHSAPCHFVYIPVVFGILPIPPPKPQCLSLGIKIRTQPDFVFSRACNLSVSKALPFKYDTARYLRTARTGWGGMKMKELVGREGLFQRERSYDSYLYTFLSVVVLVLKNGRRTS